MKPDLVEAFWARILVVTYDRGCWLWTGTLDRDGYGTIHVRDGDRHVRAHRLSWEVNRGPIPDGKGVLHSCDVRCCVRPEHLFLGDQLANIADCVAKKRHAFGEGVPGAKLTDGDVIEVRELYASGRYSHRSLAEIFGVAHTRIGAIVRHEKWRHL